MPNCGQLWGLSSFRQKAGQLYQFKELFALCIVLSTANQKSILLISANEKNLVQLSQFHWTKSTHINTQPSLNLETLTECVLFLKKYFICSYHVFLPQKAAHVWYCDLGISICIELLDVSEILSG